MVGEGLMEEGVAVSCQLSVISDQLLAFGYWLLAVSCCGMCGIGREVGWVPRALGRRRRLAKEE
jgi:hypothetical protein